MTERWGVASDRVDARAVRGVPNGAVAQTRPPDGGIADSATRSRVATDRSRSVRGTTDRQIFR